MSCLIPLKETLDLNFIKCPPNQVITVLLKKNNSALVTLSLSLASNGKDCLVILSFLKQTGFCSLLHSGPSVLTVLTQSYQLVPNFQHRWTEPSFHI